MIDENGRLRKALRDMINLVERLAKTSADLKEASNILAVHRLCVLDLTREEIET
jgi:hypothetical protein